jgi:DNA-binding Lrp family transcriptional regulator
MLNTRQSCGEISSVKLDKTDKAILSLAQGSLPISARPYDEWANQMNIPVEEVISRLNALKERGVIRDIKAVLRHSRAGVSANAMVVWAVPEGRIDELGKRIASREEVSHCYERVGFEPYTVFSMIHGDSRERVEKVVQELSAETGIKDFRVYWSLKEFKKSSMKFFT